MSILYSAIATKSSDDWSAWNTLGNAQFQYARLLLVYGITEIGHAWSLRAKDMDCAPVEGEIFRYWHIQVNTTPEPWRLITAKL
jgi:hypothetical protein